MLTKLHRSGHLAKYRPVPACVLAAASIARSLVIAGLMLFYSALAAADCTCLWQGSFVDVHPDADVVIAGEVTDGRGNSMDIDITRILRGPDYLQEVRVWLESADYCRPPRELFPVGSTWVMALQRIDSIPEDGFDPNTPDISYGRVGDYSLSNCGGYWLKLTGDRVSGALVNSARWAREPEMTPVLLDLIDAHVNQRIGDDAVLEASRADPQVKKLILDTKEFLRSIRE